MFADVADLHMALLAKEPRSFISQHIFEQVPFAFGQDRTAWILWKETLAALIDVDPQDVVMVGSAAVGFSLNPNKAFKAFDIDSDFDCGVVSGHYFDVAWRYLRQLRVSWLTLSPEGRKAITDHRKQYIFAGTIAADQMLALLPFGQAWQAALDSMARIEPTKGRDVRLRIYKDFDSLRYYQSTGIEKVREQISESGSLSGVNNDDDKDVPTEDDV